MVKRDDVIMAVIRMCKMWGFNYMPWDNGKVDYDKIPMGIKPPFRYENQLMLMLQHNKLGHKDLVFYSNNNGDLVAVQATHVTETLLKSCDRLGMFYGFSYRRVEKVPHESEAYYFIF